MTVDELVTQLQAIQVRGGGKLQVVHPQPYDNKEPKVVYQLAVITSEPKPKGSGFQYVSLNPDLREFDREVPKDQSLE